MIEVEENFKGFMRAIRSQDEFKIRGCSKVYKFVGNELYVKGDNTFRKYSLNAKYLFNF